MKKEKPIKIRRAWKINPKERIRDNKEKFPSNPCGDCYLYIISPEVCLECDNWELEEF
jgi:hypothetical protein